MMFLESKRLVCQDVQVVLHNLKWKKKYAEDDRRKTLLPLLLWQFLSRKSPLLHVVEHILR